MEAVLFGFLVTIALASSNTRACTNNSHVVTSFQELVSQSGAVEFQSGSSHGQNYSELLITDGKLIVAARNYVFLINIQDLSLIKVVDWSSSSYDAQRCVRSSRPQGECFNFIQVLQPFQGRLLVCGTNSYKPICTWKNLTDLSSAAGTDDNGNIFKEKIDAVGLVPYSPKFSSTGVMSEHGRFYAGTMRDGAARDPTIFSVDFHSRPRILETSRGDSNWLKDSEFVKSFSIDKYVYFFFREAAIENVCSNKKISRVARICKGDYGGSKYFLKKNFVTYNKARLSCSTPGEYPSYFDYIQDVFWDEKSSVFYAVFTTHPNGADGSAICVFSGQEMERVFNGNYKYHDRVLGQWVSRTNQHHFGNCSVKASSQLPFSDAEKKKLVPDGMMATPIMTQQAIMDSKDYQLMESTVQPRTKTAQYIKQAQRFSAIAVDHVMNKIVMYVGTDRGSILKLFKPVGHNVTCIVEEIKIFQKEQASPISKMQLDSQRGFLYVATSSKLIKVKLNRCERHKDKTSCLLAHDPYCGWSAGRCSSWKNRDKNSGWEQQLDRCPIAKPTWSAWSAWGVCPQADGNVCQCQHRACLHTCNPIDCHGTATQLRECTVDKHYWTDEATWLKEGVVHGNWTLWTQWDECSVTLGTGVRKRYRFCIEPVPKNGGRYCQGGSREYSVCTVHSPPKLEKRKKWTEVVGVFGKENTGARYRYTCAVQGHGLVNMTLGLTKTEYIDCSKTPEMCKIPPTKPPGLWRNWAIWTECKVVGMQNRQRDCQDVDKPCVGLKRQDRQCYPNAEPSSTLPNTELLVDTSWNSWSKCSCGLSFMKKAKDTEEPIGIEHRSRRCREIHPSDGRCPDDRTQYRTCKCKSNSSVSKYDGSNIPQKTGYRIGDVIGAAIVTGVLVLVLCAVMAYVLIRRRKNFDVSKAFERSMQESTNDSKYEGTNGPVVVESTGSWSLKNMFKRTKESPDAV